MTLLLPYVFLYLYKDMCVFEQKYSCSTKLVSYPMFSQNQICACSQVNLSNLTATYYTYRETFILFYREKKEKKEKKKEKNKK